MIKTTRLRELIVRSGIVKIVGAHNAMGAKLAEKNGFDGVWASGLEISASHAVPDANILTMTEFLSAAISMNDAVSLPIIADCDTGFGNSNNVIQMVKKYESAGIAAVCIEDKRFPKVNSFIAGRQELVPVAEFVGKIMAAKNAQKTTDFMVIARTEALIVGWGLEEALRRAKAYAGAGADAILVHSKAKTPAEIAEFVKRWDMKVPLVVVPTTYSSVTMKDLEKLGVKMVIYANQGIRASIKAIDEVFGQILRDGTASTIENKIVSVEEVFDLQGVSKMKENETIYMRSEGHITAVIPAAGDHLDEYSMKHIASDIPMAMLDVNGKPLLQRQAETLNRAGITDICVVGGYKREKIDVDGVKVLANPEYEKTGILHSIMSAREKMNGNVFIAYADILFDDVLLKKFIESNEDITLVIDGTLERKGRKGRTDLVVTDSTSLKGRRTLNSYAKKGIINIGVHVDPRKAHYEHAGLVFLSAKGCKILKDVFEDVSRKYGGKRFHEAETFEKAGLADILQEIIDRGHKVFGLEVNSGWMEIHSFDDYKFACSNVR